MDNVAVIILFLFLGIILGALLVFLVNHFKGVSAQNNANKLLENAKKEAEKHKRDSLLELKEESYKLKQQTNAEIKEKKQELLTCKTEKEFFTCLEFIENIIKT